VLLCHSDSQLSKELLVMPYYNVNSSIKLNYTIHRPQKESPSIPWIVLICGLADPQATWDPQISALLARGHTVLTYDNRGVGKSSRPTEDGEVYTADDMASDLRSLVKGVNVPKPYHVMGISM
jgi:alpha-beta hydrolase superfamily lysophospholipase